MVRIQLLVASIFAIFIGILYDVTGRKVLLGVGLGGMGFILTLLPAFVSSILSLTVLRVLFGLFVNIALFNPLILDYVLPESRGRGYSIALAGVTAGLLLAYGFVKLIDYDQEHENDW